MVPFAALPDGEGKYLIERHTISTAPSIQTLEFTQVLAKRVVSLGGALVVGDPNMPEYNGTRLLKLNGARQEAIDVGKLLNTAPLLGEQATKKMSWNKCIQLLCCTLRPMDYWMRSKGIYRERSHLPRVEWTMDS